jgi:5-methylcytosine-specific restriction protein A
MPKRPTECAYCGGPLPPPALTGRPRSFCSVQCRQANEWIVVSQRREEMERREAKQREAEWRAREKARGDKAEREYQRAIKAGGDVAAEAKWQRLYDQVSVEGRYGLCQWDLPNGHPGACTNRTVDVFCAKHNRQLDREIQRNRKSKEREAEPSVPKQTTPSTPRVRRRPTNHNVSNWAAYKTKHPERAAFYASSTWRVMRDRHLKANPTCVVCGARASHADHVVSIALGGSQDGQLQSMCAEHHHAKTVRDSHEAAKRAAPRRRRGAHVR